MGASGWSHFVPYQTDINAALQEIRQQVYERGDYYKADHSGWRNETEAELLARQPNDDPHIRQIMLEEWRQINQLQEPTDIKSLIRWNREEGTHSIIDILRGVSEEPTFGTVSPLTSQQLRNLFGTTQPILEMVKSKLEAGDLYYLRDNWQGLYIIFYDDNHPSEICFAGFSGD